MRILIPFGIMVFSLMIISGCSMKDTDLSDDGQIKALIQENNRLTSNINSLKQENEKLQKELEKFNESLNILYFTDETKGKLLFVPKETEIVALPKDGAAPLNKIFPNTVVIIDKIAVVDQETWFFVQIPTYDTPVNNMGWIRERDTVPYTAQNQHLVESPIYVVKGQNMYDLSEEEDRLILRDEKVYTNNRCHISERKNDGLRVDCAGGETYWVTIYDVIYPSLQYTESAEIAKTYAEQNNIEILSYEGREELTDNDYFFQWHKFYNSKGIVQIPKETKLHVERYFIRNKTSNNDLQSGKWGLLILLHEERVIGSAISVSTQTHNYYFPINEEKFDVLTK